MAARKYEPGQRINGILFLREVEKVNGSPHRRGAFQCPHCQNEFIIWLQNVQSGNTASCGCQLYKNQPVKHGHSRSAKLRTPTYSSWARMIQRCTNPKYNKYQLYGGRGITICDRWLKFEDFLVDMGERPKGKTIDRFPDRNGNYEPGNCRWATINEQNRNLNTTIMVEFKGKIVALKDLTERFRVNHHTALVKHKKGIPIMEILRGKSVLVSHSFGLIAA